MMRPRSWAWVGAGALFAACGGDSAESTPNLDAAVDDAGASDTSVPDGGELDVAVADVGVATDTGSVDADADADAQGCVSLCGATCTNTTIDAKNCGACGHDCLGGACVGGACQPVVLASNQTAAYGLGLNATDVFWTIAEPTLGEVRKCSKDGCNDQPTAIAINQQNPMEIAVDGTSVFFTRYDSAGGVYTCPVVGCPTLSAPTKLVSAIYPTAIAIDATNVYYSASSLYVCARAGCSNTPTALAGGGARGMALDGTNVYWTIPSEARACAKTGCSQTPTTLASAQSSATGVATDGVNVYWTNDVSSTGSVNACSTAGCSGSLTTLASSQNQPAGVAVDATHVYWTTLSAVMRCAVGGCSDKPEKLSSSGGGALAIDDTRIYWISSGTVLTLAK